MSSEESESIANKAQQLEEYIGLNLSQIQVAFSIASGESIKNTAKRFNVGLTTIYGWSKDPGFMEFVENIAIQSVKSGMYWASNRYQALLEELEEIAFDRENSTRERISAITELLKRGEKLADNRVEAQLRKLSVAVLGKAPIEIVTQDLIEELQAKNDETDSVSNQQDRSAAPKELSGSDNGWAEETNPK